MIHVCSQHSPFCSHTLLNPHPLLQRGSLGTVSIRLLEMGAYLLSPTLLFLVTASLSSAWAGALPADSEALNDYIMFLANKEKLLSMQEEEVSGAKVPLYSPGPSSMAPHPSLVTNQLLTNPLLQLRLREQILALQQDQLKNMKDGQAAKPVSSKEHTDGRRLVFHDDFNAFNLSVWKHEITLGGK